MRQIGLPTRRTNGGLTLPSLCSTAIVNDSPLIKNKYPRIGQRYSYFLDAAVLWVPELGVEDVVIFGRPDIDCPDFQIYRVT